jgi:hypothetical protein
MKKMYRRIGDDFAGATLGLQKQIVELKDRIKMRLFVSNYKLNTRTIFIKKILNLKIPSLKIGN